MKRFKKLFGIISIATLIVCAMASCDIDPDPPAPDQVRVTGVSLSRSSAGVDIGDTTTLSVTVLPSTADNKSVTWSTSDASKATVTSGVIRGVAVGTATITVTTADGGYTATCSVTVSRAAGSVTGVSLNKRSTTLLVYGTETLFATVAPASAIDKSIKWSSSDSSKVTVSSSGVVTGIAVGTADITVTTDDGNKTAKCAVTVSATAVAVTGVSLDKTSSRLAVGGSETLVPAITPSGATNQNLTWSSSNTSVATVAPNGKVTAVAAGTALISVTTVDGGWTAYCDVTVEAPAQSKTLSVSIIGTVAVGAELEASVKINFDASVEIFWLRNDREKIGSGAYYNLSVQDEGQKIGVLVEAGGLTAKSEQKTVPAANYKIKIGQDRNDWKVSDSLRATIYAGNIRLYDYYSDISYQWYRDNTLVTGATNSRYYTKEEDGGSKIMCKVTIKDKPFNSEQVSIAALSFKYENKCDNYDDDDIAFILQEVVEAIEIDFPWEDSNPKAGYKTTINNIIEEDGDLNSWELRFTDDQQKAEKENGVIYIYFSVSWYEQTFPDISPSTKFNRLNKIGEELKSLLSSLQ